MRYLGRRGPWPGAPGRGPPACRPCRSHRRMGPRLAGSVGPRRPRPPPSTLSLNPGPVPHDARARCVHDEAPPSRPPGHDRVGRAARWQRSPDRADPAGRDGLPGLGQPRRPGAAVRLLGASRPHPAAGRGPASSPRGAGSRRAARRHGTPRRSRWHADPRAEGVHRREQRRGGMGRLLLHVPGCDRRVLQGPPIEPHLHQRDRQRAPAGLG